MIFPTSLLNSSQKTSLSKTLPPLNIPTTTSTPPNPVHTVSSASGTNSEPTTYQYITGIVNSPTAPFITVTRPCRISLAPNPSHPTPPATMDLLPLLSSMRLLKSSPRHSQPPSSR